ncbi:MAG: ABC transporter permease [Chitinispirillaceae bacterium]|nr:ABC transporter permease [Chitinispirillaceae bacterium]
MNALLRFAEMLLVNFRLCILEISSAAGRTAITSLGLFLGVASLLTNLAFVRGLDDDLRANMEQIGGLNIVTVRAIDPKTPQERREFQRSPGLSFAAAETATHGLSYVKSVIRSRELGWQHFSGLGNHAWGYLIAVDPSYFPLFNYEIDQGRFLTDDDLRKRNDVCLVGERLAQRLSLGADPIGKRITVRSIPLTVVGILTSGSVRSRRDSECCIPFSIYASRFENADKHLESVSIALTASDHVERARTELLQRFTAEHRGVKDFDIETSADKIREMRSTSMALKLVLWCIAAITLLVGGISIMNIMFATIGDRIREIGIRKSLGARRYDVFTQFMLEAVLVCFFGGIPGMAVGTAIVFMPPGIFPYLPRLTPLDFTIAFGFTLTAGLLSGLFPALRAANMQPVEALRY